MDLATVLMRYVHRSAVKEKDMNWDQVKGNWKQFRGKVKEQWGHLTDDELDLSLIHI